MTAKSSGPGRRPDHRPRMVKPRQHDTYARPAKSGDSMVCDVCSVVFHGGRWYWGQPPVGKVGGGLCPACERTRERYPAGTIRVRRELVADVGELRRAVKHVEEAETAEHPLERVMAVEESDDELVITTTGLHVARRIANKLERILHAQARFHYPEEEHRILVEL